uniref:Uncharacterized protein n=1 Tax=Sphaerodactylus townsendi TaxID=933632 RepID=A0ACB8FMC1_9SAUR
MARLGLMGRVSSSYCHLFPRDEASITTVASTYPQYLEPTAYGGRCSIAAQGAGSLDRSSQSSRESRGSARLSLITSARLIMSMRSSSRRSVSPASLGDGAEGDHVDKKEQDASPEVKEKKTLKSKSSSPHIPHVTIRPGSNTKAVLPPIPSGRKKHNS